MVFLSCFQQMKNMKEIRNMGSKPYLIQVSWYYIKTDVKHFLLNVKNHYIVLLVNVVECQWGVVVENEFEYYYVQ